MKQHKAECLCKQTLRFFEIQNRCYMDCSSFTYSTAHCSNAFRTGMNFRPISVKEYSTLGGTSR